MYLRCTKWVNAGYIVHFLAMYLQCTRSVHHTLPPVRGAKERTTMTTMTMKKTSWGRVGGYLDDVDKD